MFTVGHFEKQHQKQMKLVELFAKICCSKLVAQITEVQIKKNFPCRFQNIQKSEERAIVPYSGTILFDKSE